jgi:hypothetical protein
VRPRPQFQAAVVKFNLKSNSNHFKTDSNHSNFDRFKKDLPELKIFEIKYGCEAFEEINHFLHSNFFRFEMDFELKSWEAKVYF